MIDKKGVQKIAFCAPLKSPQHPQPSGDRLLAQLLFKALQLAGFEVELVSNFRTRDAIGDLGRQRRMVRLGQRLAERQLRQWRKKGYSPDLVFCYHSYYKAPDLIGFLIAEQLRIPYWIAEASWAARRAHGPWGIYHQVLARGLQLASGCTVLNPKDEPALKTILPPRARLHRLPAFLDLDTLNKQWSPAAQTVAPENSPPKLVSVAMLRPGDKLHSLALLAHALWQVGQPFQLHIIGDGTARQRARSLFIGLPVFFQGKLERDELRKLVGSCDLMVWPAVNEAIGMALLEAQSCGVPVLAGREGGTASVVEHGQTGELVDKRDAQEFALALQRLLEHPTILSNYRKQTVEYVQSKHGMRSAAVSLRQAINGQ
ncbi:MAG: glycosyltransferase family 4 protein [Granulosicoccaceae bacterium]